MESALKDLGVTFLVGAFAILGLEFVLHYLLKFDLTGFFAGQLGLSESGPLAKAAGGVRANLSATVFIMLAFAVGVVTEDVSYKFMDSGVLPASEWLPASFNSKQDRRASVLLRKCPHGHLIPTPLGHDLAVSGAFTRFLNSAVVMAPVQQWFSTCQDDAAEQCHSQPAGVTHAADRLYYFAKNMVYRHNNYYDEMKRIQTRSEFSRSILIVSFIYGTLGLLIALCLLLWPAARPKYEEDGTSFGRESLRVLGFLLFAMLISYQAFERESDEFNKRAFGYFSSQLIHEADSASRRN